MEYWDIYDADKKPTGRMMKRNDWNMKPGDYHLTVQGVLKRNDGKYLITQRVASKAWAPLWWEFPGGGAIASETSRQAVNREILEETGIDVSGIKEDLIYTYKRENPSEGDNYFVDTYVFTVDFEESDVKIRDDEAADYKLVTLDEIKALASKGIFMHYESMKPVFEQ